MIIDEIYERNGFENYKLRFLFIMLFYKLNKRYFSVLFIRN